MALPPTVRRSAAGPSTAGAAPSGRRSCTATRRLAREAWACRRRSPPRAGRRRRHLGGATDGAAIDALHLRARGRLAAVAAALPPTWSASRPRLLLAEERWPGSSGQVEVVELSLAAAERVSTGADDEPFEPVGRPGASLFANVPATIALERAFLAEFRGDAEASIAFASRHWQSSTRRMDAGVHHPGAAGRGRLAARRAAEAENVIAASMPGSWRPAIQSRRLGLLLPWPDPARAGPPGRCASDLPAGAGDHRDTRPPAAAGVRRRLCRPGGAGLPASELETAARCT